MPTGNPSVQKLFLVTGTLLGWFALIGQLVLTIQHNIVSRAETLIRYLSYFTILTNILVTVCLTCLWLLPSSTWGKFFARPANLTAVAMYITIVGLVYNVVLASIWDPQGLQYLVDELLHSVIPVLFILYWLLYVPKASLQWKNILPWLAYPALYCLYTLIHGAFADWYPYPFVDPLQLGYPKVFLNIAGLVLLFVVMSLLYVAIGRTIVKFRASR